MWCIICVILQFTVLCRKTRNTSWHRRIAGATRSIFFMQIYISHIGSVETHDQIQSVSTNKFFFCHEHFDNTLSTLYRSLSLDLKTNSCTNNSTHCSLYSLPTVPPLPKRIHIQITAVLINSLGFIEYFRVGVVLATYLNCQIHKLLAAQRKYP